MINTYAYEIKPHIFDSIIVTVKDDDNNYVELLAMKDKTIGDYRTFLHGEVNSTIFQKDHCAFRYGLRLVQVYRLQCGILVTSPAEYGIHDARSSRRRVRDLYFFLATYLLAIMHG